MTNILRNKIISRNIILGMFLVFTLSLFCIAGSAGATGEDTTAPNLSITGFTANGNPMDSSGNTYTLNTDGNANKNYLIQFSSDSVASEELEDEYVELRLIPAEGQTSILQNYYGTNYPDNYETYLKGAAAGTSPFAYIKIDGTNIQLLDGAQHTLASKDVDMIIPGDCPAGEYRVEGQIQDLAGNKKTVTFTLKVVPTFNGVVTGNVSVDDRGIVTGNTIGDFIADISGGLIAPPADQHAYFSGIISGNSINGVIKGGVTDNGYDTLYAEVTGTGAKGYVYLLGGFEGENKGDFVGRFITRDTEIDFIDSIIISGPASVEVGETATMSVGIVGGEEDATVAWAIYVNDSDFATIDQATGVLTAIKPGTVTVIANALDGSLLTTTCDIEIVDTIAPIATADGSVAGTITYSFNEPVQLTNNDGTAITDGTTIASTLTVYAVNGSDYGTATKVTSIEITGATLNGNVLTITYTGTLIKQDNTKYIVDAWGYKISDMSGNKMLPTESAMFEVTGDGTAPELNVTGFTANGSTAMVLVDGAYTLNINGVSGTDNTIQFSTGSTVSESLKENLVALKLIPTAAQSAELKAYYSTKPAAYQTYLNSAAEGTSPFAYIKIDGTNIQLLDGAQHTLASKDVDMIIPNDYPVGTYVVSGEIEDLVGNKTTVTFTLKIVDSTPPVATANGETSGTITYSFNEPVQLTNNDGSAIAGTIASTLAVYAVTGSDYETASMAPGVTITGATLEGSVLTITYTGTLIKQDNTKYIVDAWGYKISDMSGNKMLPTESAMFEVTGDGTAPELNVTGFTANGSTAMVLVDGAYTLNINGVSGTDNTIQFSTGSTVSESLKENLVALKLIPTAAQSAELKAYYSTKPAAYQTYLNSAAEGTSPFAYIKIDGTNIQLLDGAQHTLASKDVDMIIPNDYPVGTYVVSGEIEDLVGNKKTVTFTLKPEVVVDNTVSSVTVTVTPGTNNATVNYNTLINEGTGTIPQTTINTSAANVSIPSSTTVTSSDTSWDGVMSVPTVTNITVPNTSSETRTTDSAIQVGFSGARLSFSNAVRLLLPGQAQKRVGYTTDGINFIEITNTCSADTQEVGNALLSDGECKITVGTDLVIWTKHFTTFATFTATPIVYGGGGGSYTAVNNSLIVPTGGYTLTINNGDERTLNQQVILSLNGGSNATKMIVVNGDSFANTSQDNYSTSKSWMLTSGEGEKQVCVRFYSASGEYSDPVCASIYFGAESEGEVLGAEDENMEVTSIGQSNTLIATLLSLIQSKISEGSITDSQARTFLLSLIQSIISNFNPTVTQQTYSCDGVTFDRDLEIGAEGEDVRCLQQILNSDVETQVANEGEGSSGNETIYFGELTKRALIKFQIKNGIAPAEGYFGSITRAFLDQ